MVKRSFTIEDRGVIADYSLRITKWMASQRLLIPSADWLEDRAVLASGIEYLVRRSVDADLAVAIFRIIADRIEEPKEVEEVGE